MCNKFRTLTADEIEVRVGTANEKTGVSLLLYKDARADMVILDETVGAENWQRRHSRDNANCIVSIWCAEKGQWIEKEDTGTKSNTEEEKGLASDSFKRACTNWGIGRELYTAPFIWVNAGAVNWATRNGKAFPKDRFSVKSIAYDSKRRISVLEIANQKGEVVFGYFSQDSKLVCKNCGKPVVAVKRPDGTSATPEEVLSGCGGLCYRCYKEITRNII